MYYSAETYTDHRCNNISASRSDILRTIAARNEKILIFPYKQFNANDFRLIGLSVLYCTENESILILN